MATNSKAHSITAEKLQNFELVQLDTLRANALKQGADDVVKLCDEEIAKRPPRRMANRRATEDHGPKDVVTGYHFVCSRDRGVIELGDGRFWSGSWVVAKRVAEDSLKYGAYFALHENKSQQSYRQGQVIDCRTAPRGMVEAAIDGHEITEEGIEFLVQSTDQTYEWVGTGAGEKGYRWEKPVNRGKEAADVDRDRE